MDKIEKKITKTKSKSKAKLTHKTYFPCAQQPSGSMLCGFYVALNMMDLLADISIMKKASISDYKAITGKADQGSMRMVQGMLCESFPQTIGNRRAKARAPKG